MAKNPLFEKIKEDTLNLLLGTNINNIISKELEIIKSIEYLVMVAKMNSSEEEVQEEKKEEKRFTIKNEPKPTTPIKHKSFNDGLEDGFSLTSVKNPIDLDRVREISKEQKELNKNKLPEHVYRLTTRLNGGVLTSDDYDGEIFMPEQYIRRIDASDGDLIRAMPKRNVSGKYDFLIEKKNAFPSDKLKQTFNFGVVNYDEELKKFYVDSNCFGDSFRDEEGAPQRHIALSGEVSRFGLAVGDLVDIAWWKGDFNSALIAWKHTVKDGEVRLTEAQKIKFSKMKEKAKQLNTKDVEKEEISPVFEGKSIVLLGGEPYHAKFKSLIEERGGELITLTGTEPKIKITNLIKNNDAVVIAKSYVSHSASIHANDKAKIYDKPYGSFDGFGGETFLMTVYKLLDLHVFK